MKNILVGVGLVVSLLIVSWTGIWVWLLSSSDILHHPTTSYHLFPIACTTKGCITSATWLEYYTLANQFDSNDLIEKPTPEQALTTLLRQHLVENASVRPTATIADARRYREDVLHIMSENDLSGTIPVSLDLYDREVILPFLQQEGLRQLYKAETRDELYQTLADQRALILFPFSYTWDKEHGRALPK